MGKVHDKCNFSCNSDLSHKYMGVFMLIRLVIPVPTLYRHI